MPLLHNWSKLKSCVWLPWLAFVCVHTIPHHCLLLPNSITAFISISRLDSSEVPSHFPVWQLHILTWHIWYHCAILHLSNATIRGAVIQPFRCTMMEPDTKVGYRCLYKSVMSGKPLCASFGNEPSQTTKQPDQVLYLVIYQHQKKSLTNIGCKHAVEMVTCMIYTSSLWCTTLQNIDNGVFLIHHVLMAGCESQTALKRWPKVAMHNLLNFFTNLMFQHNHCDLYYLSELY